MKYKDYLDIKINVLSKFVNEINNLIYDSVVCIDNDKDRKNRNAGDLIKSDCDIIDKYLKSLITTLAIERHLYCKKKENK